MKSFAEDMADKMGSDADGDEPDADDSPDYGESYKASVEDFISAVHSKDADAAADALHRAIELCSKAHPEPDGDEGGGGHAALLLMPHGKA